MTAFYSCDIRQYVYYNYNFSSRWGQTFWNKSKLLYVIIMSGTNFRVSPHSIVWLNVKELFARSRGHIWCLSESNVIRTHNHLVCKRTLNHIAKLAKWPFSQTGQTGHLVKLATELNHLANLAKWLSVRLQTKWLWVRITLLSLKSKLASQVVFLDY